MNVNELNFCSSQINKGLPEDLIDDMRKKIFLQLDLCDLSNALTTCKKWSAILISSDFLNEWLQRHNKRIYFSCNKLPLQQRQFYQKNFLAVEKINKNILKIEREQKMLFAFNMSVIIISTPILIPIAIKTINTLHRTLNYYTKTPGRMKFLLNLIYHVIALH